MKLLKLFLFLLFKEHKIYHSEDSAEFKIYYKP